MWVGQSLDNLNFSFINLDAPIRNDMTQYHPFLYHEVALFPIQHKINFLASMEYLGYIF